MNVFEHVFPAAEGPPIRLDRWHGQPILITNTASKCEFTPQYEGLQGVYEEFRRSGLQVVALPSNDFGDGEPEDVSGLMPHLIETYGVTFPVSSTIRIRGTGAHPLFVALRDRYGEDIMPRWNFHKYLFDRQGDLVQGWPAQVTPADPDFRHQLQRNLNSWIL